MAEQYLDVAKDYAWDDGRGRRDHVQKMALGDDPDQSLFIINDGRPLIRRSPSGVPRLTSVCSRTTDSGS